MKAVPPYLLPAPGRVQVSEWEYLCRGEWIALPEVLPDWDYNTSLSVRRRANIDLPGALADAALGLSAPLAWLISWRATDSKLAGSAPRIEVRNGESLLTAMLPGSELGVAVDLVTHLVLASGLPPGDVAAAHSAGSILYEDQRRIVLQGDLGQFPIAIIDFADSGLDGDGSFVVEIADDPSTPVLAGVLLLVNSRDQRLVSALTGIDTSSDAAALLEQVEEEVYIQLLDHVARHATNYTAKAWDEETIGWVGSELCGRVDIAPNPRALSELRESHFSLYKTLLTGEARRSGMGREYRT